MALWATARDWSGPQRAGARTPESTFYRAARDALLAHQGAADTYHSLQRLIGEGARDDAAFRGQVLALMRAIDEVYYLVHPRTTLAPPSSGLRPALPAWLRASRDQRLLTGCYIRQEEHVLLPRGPLLRGARHPTTSSADSLADRFAALSVASPILEQDGRRISVRTRVIPTSIARGVAPGRSVGAESVAFVPIAEAADEIIAKERATGDQGWVDFQPAPTINPHQRILDALSEAGAIDLMIAPEFMICEAHADELATALSAHPCKSRLLVAGSGATNSISDGQPWNEARAVNSSGAELWRQRKLWPAGLDADRADKFGLNAPTADTLLYEDSAGGDELVVCDIEGLGRCVILICQDLKAQLLAEQLMIQYQPDWVFAPLLDTGVGEGRWMHRRAFALSALAQTRFVFVSSTSLAAKAGFADPACALAIGPEEPSSSGPSTDSPAAFQLAQASTHGSCRMAVIQWRHGRWLRSSIKAT